MPLPAADDFRTLLPEFSDAASYTDDQISTWISIAANFVSETRWGSVYNLGISLVAAHNLVLSKRELDAAALGGTPGEVTGPVVSQAVDKVSVSYSTSDAVNKDAGSWNLTTYGVRYRSLCRVFGAGGLVV